MGLVNYMKNKLFNWLQFQPAPSYGIVIKELLDYQRNAYKNKIWYRGESYEIEQLYKQIPNTNYSFWGSVPTKGLEIRKIHTGLPAIIIDVLASIVLSDLNDFDFKNSQIKKEWIGIEKENRLKKLFERALKEVLCIGDGAFKISFDAAISEHPIVEFYSGEKIEIVNQRGRMKEVVFYTSYQSNNQSYHLKEFYGFGYIRYQLLNAANREVSLSVVPELSDLKSVEFDKSLNMAIPLMVYESGRWEGRGQSLFDRKIDNFDAFDEIWSQWIGALRAGRAKEYIPESLLPRHSETGAVLKPNPFDNRYIKHDNNMKEESQDRIHVEQPSIPHESYLSTYVTALDLCLQGIISPSTLGIDVKKLDNAEAQREKEKATLYTRGAIVKALQETLPLLIDSILKASALWKNIEHEVSESVVSFGEYANPSFEAQIETLGKARTSTIMSVEAAVDELYGDTKGEEWKSDEVKRIKEELGIAELNEPMIGNVSALDSLKGEVNNESVDEVQESPIPDDKSK